MFGNAGVEEHRVKCCEPRFVRYFTRKGRPNISSSMEQSPSWQVNRSSATQEIPTITRWFKYDRNKLWLVHTQIVPVIFEHTQHTQLSAFALSPSTAHPAQRIGIVTILSTPSSAYWHCHYPQHTQLNVLALSLSSAHPAQRIITYWKATFSPCTEPSHVPCVLVN
jgi:hypothetical protein